MDKILLTYLDRTQTCRAMQERDYPPSAFRQLRRRGWLCQITPRWYAVSELGTRALGAGADRHQWTG